MILGLLGRCVFCSGSILHLHLYTLWMRLSVSMILSLLLVGSLVSTWHFFKAFPMLYVHKHVYTTMERLTPSTGLFLYENIRYDSHVRRSYLHLCSDVYVCYGSPHETVSTENATSPKSTTFTKSSTFRSLGISRYKLKLNFWFNLNLFRGIWKEICI